MNPVVGLDVAKGESQVQAFLNPSKPNGKSFSMKHIQRGIGLFFRLSKRN
jgi:transposase